MQYSIFYKFESVKVHMVIVKEDPIFITYTVNET